MKYLSQLFLVAILFSAMACTNNVHKSGARFTLTDSVNYVNGYVNGLSIREALVGDSATSGEVHAFARSVYKNSFLSKEAKMELDAEILAVLLDQQFSKGYLFSDSTILLEKEWFIKGFREAMLQRDSTMIMPKDAEHYIYNALGPFITTGQNINPAPAVQDSLNLCLGVVHGTNIILSKLSAAPRKYREAYVKTFAREFRRKHADDTPQLTGKRVAVIINDQMNHVEFLLNDSLYTLNTEMFKRGLYEGIKLDKSIFASPDEAKEYIDYVQKASIARKNAAWKEMNEQFLDNNAQKEGVTVLPSGLQYKVLRQSADNDSNRRANANSVVVIRSAGRLLNNVEFENTEKTKMPLTINIEKLVPGLQEGVMLMPKGAVYRFYIPASLGCGEKQNGRILPYSTLVIDLQLIDIK